MKIKEMKISFDFIFFKWEEKDLKISWNLFRMRNAFGEQKERLELDQDLVDNMEKLVFACGQMARFECLAD